MNRERIDVAVGRWSHEFADQGLFTTDQQLVITSWNRWLERHSGRTAAEIIGQPLLQAFPDLKERRLDEHYHDALAGRSYLLSHLLHGYLLPLTTHVGDALFSTMRQRAHITPLVMDDRVVGTMTVIDDVSERVVTEHELRNQIAGHQAARAAAEQALRVKDEFLAMLGHELRNPLAPILTALQLLKLRGVSEVERERAIIERQVRHLVTLVNDLLDVSRIARGKLTLRVEPVHIADVIAEAVEGVAPLFEQRHHELRLDVPRAEPLVVNGDSHRLAQALINLLGNAAKYTNPGGRISLAAAASGDEVVLRVRDTGSGMDPEMLSRVFDPFVQGQQSLERSEGGLGLGLTIVRNVIALHGGSVTGSSQGRNQGSEFTVRLPRLTGAPRRPAAPEPWAEPVAARTRVLVVDDNKDAAALLCDMLSAVGYISIFALDGPSALGLSEDFDPDIAILDIGLPVMDGYALADRFARHPRLCRTQLVAVTGYGQERDRKRAAESGFRAHLVKPVEVTHLRSVLESLREPAVGEGLPSH